MSHLLTLESFGTLLMLIALQLVLGFDNLLYISIESKRAPIERQSYVRKFGIGLAVILRIGLLFALVNLIKWANVELFSIDIDKFMEGHFNLHSLIVLFGGVFIIYTALKEIWHMIGYNDNDLDKEKKTKSVGSVIMWIVIMNLVFSFDSILSAMALTENNYIIAIAIIIGGVLMIVAANKVAVFLQKNRMYEVLGLFILFLVGIMLISDGGHQAHMKILSQEISPMNKSTFYFILTILVIIDIVQSKYQKNLLKSK